MIVVEDTDKFTARSDPQQLGLATREATLDQRMVEATEPRIGKCPRTASPGPGRLMQHRKLIEEALRLRNRSRSLHRNVAGRGVGAIRTTKLIACVGAQPGKKPAFHSVDPIEIHVWR